MYTEVYTKEEAHMLAEQHFHEFLENLIEKGVQIVENNVKIEVGSNTCKAYGNLVAIEEISSFSAAEIKE